MVKYRKKLSKAKVEEIEKIAQKVGKAVEKKEPNKTLIQTLAKDVTQEAPKEIIMVDEAEKKPTEEDVFDSNGEEIPTTDEQEASETYTPKVVVSDAVQVENMTPQEVSKAVNTPPTGNVSQKSSRHSTLPTTLPSSSNALRKVVAQRGGRTSQLIMEGEILSIMNALPNQVFSKDDLRTIIVNDLKPNPSIMTKGGSRTSGKPVWKVDADWAIYHLAKKGQIKALGNKNFTSARGRPQPIGLNLIPTKKPSAKAIKQALKPTKKNLAKLKQLQATQGKSTLSQQQAQAIAKATATGFKAGARATTRQEAKARGRRRRGTTKQGAEAIARRKRGKSKTRRKARSTTKRRRAR